MKVSRFCLLLFVCTFFYGCALIPAALVPAAIYHGTAKSTSAIISAPPPDFIITDKQADKIFEDSIILGKSWGYSVMEEDKEDGYLLQGKKTPDGGDIKLSVHISIFFTIGPAVQVYGKVTGGDEDKESSGVSGDVRKLRNRIEEIFSVK